MNEWELRYIMSAIIYTAVRDVPKAAKVADQLIKAVDDRERELVLINEEKKHATDRAK